VCIIDPATNHFWISDVSPLKAKGMYVSPCICVGPAAWRSVAREIFFYYKTPTTITLNMKTKRNAFYFSETITNRELSQWEREYEKAKEAYYEAKEELSDEEKGI
jgi:hypothetical protein